MDRIKEEVDFLLLSRLVVGETHTQVPDFLDDTTSLGVQIGAWVMLEDDDDFDDLMESYFPYRNQLLYYWLPVYSLLVVTFWKKV